MSSTARGGKRSPADFYATPSWPVHCLLEALPLPGGLWLEPAAGEGAIIRAVNEKRNVTWCAFEKRAKCSTVLVPLVKQLYVGDALRYLDEMRKHGALSVGSPVVSISNYPFSLAMEFIEHGLRTNIPYVISLLRLNFVGTEDRNDFFQKNMPDIYVIPDRVSFAKSISCFRNKRGCTFAKIVSLAARVPKVCPKCGSKLRVSSTDSIEYAWFVWGPDRDRKAGKIQVLNHTPLEQRKGLT